MFQISPAQPFSCGVCSCLHGGEMGKTMTHNTDRDPTPDATRPAETAFNLRDDEVSYDNTNRTCPKLTQRGPSARGGTPMAPGLRMSSCPRCRFPLGNDRQMWVFCSVTILGAPIIGRILLTSLHYHHRTKLRDHLQACAVAIVQAPRLHQAQLFKLDQYLAC